MKSVKEFRKELRNMKEYDELCIGNDVICKTYTGYGVRRVDDENDMMTDYCAYTFGFKEKWLIERYLNKGLLVNE